ncbi:collagen binding domain-containing protein [Lactococcus fujiensis]|uniref:collagen binding domain-containing protein n=1 Tax=Lactococcus fujiensis TaxID=610251 RepID=UPI0006D183BC|nr:collagen binding domain-containing protein [Lactococcus fujiensis]
MYTIDTDNTTSPASMTITFPNGLKQGVKISYKTQVTGAIDSSINVENEAESDGQTVSAGNNSVASQGLTKTLGTVDYNKKTVGWNININKARQDMSNYQLDDEIPVGLTVDDSTFKLFDNDTKTELVRGTDYTITLTPTGFSLEFIGNLKSQAKDSYTLSYVTSFETLKLTGKTWTNNVTATWVDQKGKSHTNNGTANFTPKVEYVNDGSKSGSYNAVSKIITWTVVTNYNQRVLNNASITDKIVGDQDYVPDSVKLYEATINSDGSYTLVKPEISNNATYDAENNLLTVPLPNGSSKAYVLTYQTSLVGKIINQKTYDNTAQYVNDNISSNLVASVSVPNSGSVIEKSGSQDPSNSSYALWNIWVNKSQSTISNATVTDVPSDNQIIDESSITIYPTKVSSDGSYVENTTAPLQLGTDYTVNLVTDNTSGQQTLTIVFKNTINTAYSIHYRSLINSSLINDTLTNDASIKGTGEKPVSDDIISSTQVVNNGGSASGKNMGLVITKTDGNTGKALVGATFEIWSDVSGNKGQLLRSGTTDSSGKINWKNLKSGKYILVESSAPDGYVISTMLKKWSRN